MRRAILVLALAALLLVPAAAAQVTERAIVGEPGRNVTAGLSADLFVVTNAPPEYLYDCCRDSDSSSWKGPVYQASGQPSLAGSSKIAWSVSFDTKSPSTTDAALAALIQHFPEVSRTEVQVPHLVAGRPIGTLPGIWILTRAPGKSAQHEAALAFPLGRGVIAVVRLAVLEPFQDEVNTYGQYLVQSASGPVLASTWNAQEAAQTIAGVSLQGNLPPARVTAGVARRRLSGAVRDSFGQPLAGVTVTIEQFTGKKWVEARSTRTGAGGKYTARVPGAGRYRAVVSLDGITVRSKLVRAR